ncbi:MAG: HEPN domain-containing protein [Methylocystis sp.]|jgi:HEPN domain-containing protein|nr:HEPN domain-containing protein [Methylocystis sp.]MCA3588740.1 HEPN domain-containing protein [Methylocystis sp.]MCA3592358.1 HEPN domain-containing protein [Methylocystis sp.]
MNKLTPEKLREDRINGFLKIADEEFRAAESLVAALPRQAAYMMQQSVEKTLRAVLERDGVPAGPGHNIANLVSLLSKAHPLRDDFLAFDDLSTASTRYRYPSEKGLVAEPDVALLPKRLQPLLALRQRAIAYIKPLSV